MPKLSEVEKRQIDFESAKDLIYPESMNLHIQNWHTSEVHVRIKPKHSETKLSPSEASSFFLERGQEKEMVVLFPKPHLSDGLKAEPNPESTLQIEFIDEAATRIEGDFNLKFAINPEAKLTSGDKDSLTVKGEKIVVVASKAYDIYHWNEKTITLTLSVFPEPQEDVILDEVKALYRLIANNKFLF